MTHIMIDLETLSTKTNGSIIEIGAIAFDINDGGTIGRFDVVIKPEEWSKNGRHISGDTILWWFQQSEEARSRFAKSKSYSLKRALELLTEFIESYPYPVVWGNGSTMDITLLQSAYEYFDMPLPWQFRNVRDLRTIVALNPSIKDNTQNIGTEHNALDDCRFQINYLMATLQSLNLNSIAKTPKCKTKSTEDK